jgi:membrane protein implicated in regulation of membrane protease activity
MSAMLMSIIDTLGPWTWFVAGLILLGLEILLPGTFFLWFGVSAILVGIGALIFPGFAWQAELVVFVALAVVLVVVGRRYFAHAFARARPSGLNERATRIVGTETVLGEPIVDGKGRIRVDDTVWRVTGPDMPSGSRVKVVGADGTVLKVKREG